MWREPIIVTAPASEALSLADAKGYLRVDFADDDDLIGDHIATAGAHIEAMTGSHLVTRTIDLQTYDWEDLTWLPIAPVQSITSITYVDPDGASQTVDLATMDLNLRGLAPSIFPKIGYYWPASKPGELITVRAVSGYAELPAPIKGAMRMLVRELYEESGEVARDMHLTLEALLLNYRVYLRRCRE